MRISPQDWPSFTAARRIFDVLAQEGGEARFVGGCVRDAILNRPLGDMDMACTHPPEKTLALLEAAGIRVIPTGLAHGTVTALINGVTFEITTLREDVETDGRHAIVRYTDDWRADASRRDFTMNALSAGPDGEVHDYFGGVEDALAGHLRFIGDPDARIDEDALRILRFFRFFAHYGKAPYDAASLAACTAKAARIDNLSGERIQSEMLKLLSSPRAGEVIRTMQAHGILAHIGLQAERIDALARLDSPLLKLAALLHGKDTSSLAARWRLSNKDRDWLAHLARMDVETVRTWDEAFAKKRLRKLGKLLFIAEVQLAGALNGQETPWLDMAQDWQIPTFPINGSMLKAKGIPQGKALGETLKKLEQEWEAKGYQPTAEELLASL